MSGSLLFSLSVMMFLEYAIWGAWSPVLAARLFGPLKMSGKQTGWIYATIPLATIIAPMIAGQTADKWVQTQWFLAVAHLVGGILLFIAARKKTFGGLFVVMLLYALCYTATMPLVNSLMFAQLGKVLPDNAAVNAASGKIFLWAPVAWTIVGWILTGWRRMAKEEGDGSDCLMLAGILSLIMGVFCFFLPRTPPPGAATAVLPFVQAISLLKDNYVLIFFIISFVVTTQLMFYYLGTAQFLTDLGVKSKNVPATMAIAQAVQALATWLVLSYLLGLGFRATLTIGIACWLVMYLAYSIMRPTGMVIISQGLHGLAYVFFIIGGQIYVNTIAPQEIRSSAQALIFLVTIGLGLFVGTQYTGVVMDHLRVDGKFRWRPIFLVPCGVLLACVVVFFILFRGPITG